MGPQHKGAIAGPQHKGATQRDRNTKAADILAVHGQHLHADLEPGRLSLACTYESSTEYIQFNCNVLVGGETGNRLADLEPGRLSLACATLVRITSSI